MQILASKPNSLSKQFNLYMFAQFLDVASTYVALKMAGLEEGNPLLLPLVETYGLDYAMGVKLLVAAVFGLLVIRLPEVKARRVLGALTVLTGLIVLWNCALTTLELI